MVVRLESIKIRRIKTGRNQVTKYKYVFKKKKQKVMYKHNRSDINIKLKFHLFIKPKQYQIGFISPVEQT